MLGVGAIIGTGIFVLTGQAAAANAGPAIVLSMVLAGLTSVLAALCYSEFAATVPVAGSAYTYAYATLGEFIAWVIGWDLILEYALGAATVAVGWSGNLVTLLTQLGMIVSRRDQRGAGDGRAARRRRIPSTAVFNLPAVLITIAVTALLIVGVSESATVNAVIVVIKVAVVLIVIGAGALLHPDGELASVHSAEHRDASASTAGAACCGAPASSSSPTSGSTPCRRPRRRRAIRSATCRAASSGRWPSARCSSCSCRA